MEDFESRRLLVASYDFDTRATILSMEIGDDWENGVREQWINMKEHVKASVVEEYGRREIDVKISNLIEIGPKPFSIISHHNEIFGQIRRSFVAGAYYPALVGACGLGERLLNHLILDLRDYFPPPQAHPRLAKIRSSSNWSAMVDSLNEWGVLLPAASGAFRELMDLRHRSVHFNPTTPAETKGDAARAVGLLKEVIDKQFGVHSQQPWIIPHTNGHSFIKKSFESSPFIQVYFKPSCPLVGPYFGMNHGQSGWEFFDYPVYDEGPLSDEEFAKKFNERQPEMVARRPD